MSIDLNWDAVTGGPDGLELAHQIRDFIHARFQTVPLPRFIKSVTVHEFQFGSTPPEVELKDITDPLPDFYAENAEIDDADSDSDELGGDGGAAAADGSSGNSRGGSDTNLNRGGGGGGKGTDRDRTGASNRNSTQMQQNDNGSPFLRVSTPGVPGGTSNLHYFHSHFGTALSGSQTPLAAMAGAHHLGNSWLESHHGHSSSAPNLRQQYARAVESSANGNGHGSGSGGNGGGGGGYQPTGHNRNRNMSQSSSIMDFNQPASPNISNILSPTSPAGAAGLGITGTGGIPAPHPLREKHSVSTLAPTSAGTSRPPTRDAAAMLGGGPTATSTTSASPAGNGDSSEDSSQRRFREPRVDDMQAVFRIKYAGDIKLLLTADILLDYPMPSFVGIPVRLSITGLTFDGVGVLANIRKRVHFCFLSPEDAVAAVGGEENLDRSEDDDVGGGTGNTKLGGLLQEIRVESEIGQRESGKQSLKNVGKVERFVLEQVRRIFEEELVYPSFWTFLV